MANPIMISVLDQSPIRKGGSGSDALQESVRLAQITEELGYYRYWVAEHHNASSYAGTSPELLAGQIAARTQSIRVGCGGIMMLNYSALKIAEQFRVLEAFYPGRIDLGLGRSRGADQLASEALVYPRALINSRDFPQQVTDLLSFLYGNTDPSDAFGEVKAQPGPAPESFPDVWLLGSSSSSAELAASLGLPYAFADFLGGACRIGPSVAELYRQKFRPSPSLAEPKLNVTVDVLCAPTEEEARFLALSRNIDRVASVYSLQGLLPPAEVLEYSINEEARQHMEHWTQGCIDGNPEQVRLKILELAHRYGTNDISIVTNCYDFEHRVRSYKLIADLFSKLWSGNML